MASVVGEQAHMFHGNLDEETAMTKAEFTYRLSDHLPLWIQVNTDTDGILLDEMLAKWS